MKIWVDAQLSPVIAQWLSLTFGVEATAVRDLRLRDARDRLIFLAARDAKALILTKDSDMGTRQPQAVHAAKQLLKMAERYPEVVIEGGRERWRSSDAAARTPSGLASHPSTPSLL